MYVFGNVKFYFNSFFEVLKHAVFKMNRNELMLIEMKLNRAYVFTIISIYSVKHTQDVL